MLNMFRFLYLCWCTKELQLTMSWRKDALFLPFFRGVKNTYEIRSLLMTYWTAVNSRVVRSAIWTFKSDDREGKEQQKATKCDTCMQKVGKTKYYISWRGRCIYTFSNSKAITLQTKAWCPLSTSKEMLVSRCFFFAFTPAFVALATQQFCPDTDDVCGFSFFQTCSLISHSIPRYRADITQVISSDFPLFPVEPLSSWWKCCFVIPMITKTNLDVWKSLQFKHCVSSCCK